MRLHHLQSIDLSSCTIGDVHFSDFLDALKGSGCAAQMVRLSFVNCGIGVDGARALADLLHGDGLPALERLELGLNQNIGDEGAVVLAGGLCEAPRTMLKELELGVGMGYVGMAALASVIEHGRMGQLRYINYGMTDKGLVALARAIDAWAAQSGESRDRYGGGGGIYGSWLWCACSCICQRLPKNESYKFGVS